MLFNSFIFLVFLPIVFALYWWVFNKTLRIQNLFALLASYLFYGWWDWRFLGLLILSTLIDYYFGFKVYNVADHKKKLYLWLSVANNLLVLGIFKYYNFFIVETQTFLGSVGLHFSPYLLKLALPVGISFYTFHGMSYVFDIYRNKFDPVKSFVDYALFVSFFPLLVAGPIERASHLLPQLQTKRTFRYGQALEGLRLMLWGMFKKVVIADSLAQVVDKTFEHYQTTAGSTLLVGIVLFSFQIYCDFSGYSDIALGTAKLFGIELLSNFRFPYFSRDIAEFWRRWHISLSSWFRDYLYIPLGGSKNGKAKAIRNTFIIFLVSGFWHGASWNFIFWGGIHALLFLPLLLSRANRVHVGTVVAENRTLPNFKELLQVLSTFALVTFAWIFFRAKTLSIAIGYISGIGKHFFSKPANLVMFLYVVPLIIVDWYLRHSERVLKVPKNKWLRYSVYYTLVLVTLYKFGGNSSFIYFQF